MINRLNISEHLVEYQLKMIGKTLQTAFDDDIWWLTNTMTQKQADEFKEYAIPLLKRVFKCNRGKAESTFSWFFGNYGLRIKD